VAVQDLPRHLGRLGGMVILPGATGFHCPLEPPHAGPVVVQWDKEDCADLGIVKSICWAGYEAAIEEMLTLVRGAYREEVDLAHLRRTTAVYAALQEADTVGMFQVESRAQWQPPACVENLRRSGAVALIAPAHRRQDGASLFAPPRAGKRRIGLHPCLEPVLRRTLGVPLFQEQLCAWP